jgi:hypothetical protein
MSRGCIKQRSQPDMAQPDSAAVGASRIRTKAFQAAYLLAAGIATIGWAWLIGRCVLALFGY